MTEETQLQLVVVPAYYLDHSTGKVVEALPVNRVLAQDFAEKWITWRELARKEKGWELLLSAPASGTYTRAMFRTPEDQAAMDAAAPDSAASVDASPHQAGRAVDLSINDMQATYSNFNYNELVQLANAAGIDARLRNSSPPEPWHFDDNPRQLFGTTLAAVDAIGNTSAQVAQALQLGVERPEEIALRRWQLFKVVGVGAAVAGVILVGMVLHDQLQQEKKTKKEAAPDQAQTLGAVYAA
jgi:hypothetical protein